MNALAYACLHGQYDMVKKLIEECKMESIEGYLLAGLMGRENIISLFKDKYTKEENRTKLEDKIFDMGNGNNLIHLLSILEYMKRAQKRVVKR